MVSSKAMRRWCPTPFALTLTLSAAIASLLWATTAGPVRFWALAALVVTTLAMIAWGVMSIRLGYFGPAVTHGLRDARPGAVALTFDDGPDPQATVALLDLLAQHQVKATFFCIGRRVEEHPSLARRIVAEGHTLANHTHHHPWRMNFALATGWRREIHAAQQAIIDATEQTPRYFRPPVGMTNPHLARPLREAGLTLVGWDVRSFDTLGRPVEHVVQRVMRRVKPGSIILLHDGSPNQRISADRVTAIAGQLIDQLKAAGYRIERLDALLDHQSSH